MSSTQTISSELQSGTATTATTPTLRRDATTASSIIDSLKGLKSGPTEVKAKGMFGSQVFTIGQVGRKDNLKASNAFPFALQLLFSHDH
jgi:hypothetical protein